MKPLTIQTVALLMMLLALPLTSVGTTQDLRWLSVLGLVSLGLAALATPVLRYAGPDDDDEGDDD